MERTLYKQHFGAYRPRAWPTPAHLQYDINLYFASCERRSWEITTSEDGTEKRQEIVTQTKPLTITGMAVHLGCSRNDLVTYTKLGGEYTEIVNHAKTRCEAFAEAYLFSGKSVNGAVFSLTNNYNWHNTLRKEISGRDGEPLGISVVDDRAKQARSQLLELTEAV